MYRNDKEKYPYYQWPEIDLAESGASLKAYFKAYSEASRARKFGSVWHLLEKFTKRGSQTKSSWAIVSRTLREDDMPAQTIQFQVVNDGDCYELRFLESGFRPWHETGLSELEALSLAHSFLSTHRANETFDLPPLAKAVIEGFELYSEDFGKPAFFYQYLPKLHEAVNGEPNPKCTIEQWESLGWLQSKWFELENKMR